MRSKAAAIALAVAFSTTLTSAAVFLPQEASAQSRRGYDMFYDDLAQDGRWIDHPRYGWVWYPTRVRADWRPYSDGRWVWTDRYGWYWESNERFGWATYHYGRWGYDDRYGHIWVPGDEWAPAWVSFRDSDDAIGWAPLPPETLGMTLIALLAGGSSSSYYRYVDMSDSYYQPRWTFVPTRYFTQPRVYSHAYSWRDNDRYYRGSRNVTNYVTVNNYYVNRSIDPRRLESRIGRKIEPVHVREANSRDQWRDRDRRDERNISVFNPRIERGERGAPPPAARATATDKPAVQVRPDFAAPDERRANIRERNDRDGNDRDRSDRGSDRDRTDRDRDGRPGVTGQVPVPPGGAPSATPSDRAGQPDRDRNDGNRGQPQRTEPQRGDQDRAQQQRAEQERAQQQKIQQDRADQQRAAQQRAEQERAQQQKAQQDRAEQQRAQQQRAEQERAQQQKAMQERAQQQRAEQQRAQQQRAEQQRAQQQKVQQDRAQQQQQQRAQQKAAEERAQQQKVQQQQQRDQQRVQQQQQQQQRQEPRRQERGGNNNNDCRPGQPNCG